MIQDKLFQNMWASKMKPILNWVTDTQLLKSMHKKKQRVTDKIQFPILSWYTTSIYHFILYLVHIYICSLCWRKEWLTINAVNHVNLISNLFLYKKALLISKLNAASRVALNWIRWQGLGQKMSHCFTPTLPLTPEILIMHWGPTSNKKILVP